MNVDLLLNSVLPVLKDAASSILPKKWAHLSYEMNLQISKIKRDQVRRFSESRRKVQGFMDRSHND